MKYIDTPPQPKMAESLRHMGYSTIYASADIVDNSLDAEATDVSIYVSSDNTQKDPVTQIDIFDNGSGMTESELNEALTYGSESYKSLTALGCFGLGLKTAGTSLGRRITAITRSSEGEIVCRVLDLDNNESMNRFVIGAREVTSEEVERLNSEIGDSSGTWISISKIDAEEYKNVKTMTQALNGKKALQLIFRKFLSSGSRSIFVNGKRLEPYGYDYVDGVEVVANAMPFILNDGTSLGTVKIISTANSDFSGGKGGSRPQGLVVVRNNRDITPSVSWKGIITHDWEYNGVYAIWEVTAKEFDSLMGTTVMKNDWKLPQNVGDQLKKLINPYLMTYKKMRELKRDAERGNDESTIEKVIKDYSSNFNKNMNITPKPNFRNFEKLETPTRRSPSASSENEETDSGREPSHRTYKMKAGIDEWVFNVEPNCGNGRYYVWGAKQKQRGGMRYTVTLDSKHPWIEKTFLSTGSATGEDLWPVLDQIIASVYTEMQQDSTEAADALVHAASNVLRARANVTTLHAAEPIAMASK